MYVRLFGQAEREHRPLDVADTDREWA
jgi:hypothetical protein